MWAISATRCILSRKAKPKWCGRQAPIKLQRGDIFGEAALVSKLPRNASVRAVTAMDVVVVNREAFQELWVTSRVVRQYRADHEYENGARRGPPEEVADAMSSINQA